MYGISLLFIAENTASLNTMCPACATPSILDVVFTASPYTSSFLTITSPVCIATLILIGLFVVLLYLVNSFCSSIPHSTAFVGDLNVIRKASPIFLITFPSYLSNSGSEMLSNMSCSWLNSSLLSCAVVFVYPAMSVNITVRTSESICLCIIRRECTNPIYKVNSFYGNFTTF